MSADRQILEHFLKYISYIEEANERFNGSLSTIENDHIYKLAVTQCLAQIGELTTKLSQDFKEKTSSKIYWRGIKDLRNVVAHDYAALDSVSLWETISIDIPALKAFCEKELEEK